MIHSVFYSIDFKRQDIEFIQIRMNLISKGGIHSLRTHKVLSSLFFLLRPDLY